MNDLKGTALVYSGGLLDDLHAKTAHGLLRLSDRFELLGVIDHKHHNQSSDEIVSHCEKSIPIFENLDQALQTIDQKPDFVIIGVDRPHPRRLVHATDVPWIDLRSTGDGHVYFTNDSDPALVAMMTPDHEPASCQIAGAIAAGNIQFGYVNAAAAAATWLMGQLRNQPPLKERMSSIMFGELKFPEVNA